MQDYPELSVLVAWMAKVRLIIAVVINEGLRLRSWLTVICNKSFKAKR